MEELRTGFTVFLCVFFAVSDDFMWQIMRTGVATFF